MFRLGTDAIDGPNTELKIYLAASPEERARRRYLELLKQGEQASYVHILADLEKRDLLDSERALSPLQPATEAETVDTDGLDVEQVLAQIVGIVEARQ